MVEFIFAYLFSFVLSIIIIFWILTNRIKMMNEYNDHYKYLRYDCMIANITETKYGNQIGILSTIFVIPVMFFLMFHVMDILKFNMYYKKHKILKYKNSLKKISEDINVSKYLICTELINLDKFYDDNTQVIKIPI